MSIRTMILGVVLALSLSGLASADTIFTGDFTGYYAPGNWTLVTGEGDGYVDASGAPGRLWIYGSDNGNHEVPVPLPAYTDYLITAPGTGLVEVSLLYRSFDTDGPEWDPAGYVVNGVRTQLSDDAGDVSQGAFRVSFAVNEGDTFGFYVYSLDGLWGRGAAGVGPIPEPATYALMGLGLLLVGFVARRMRA